MQNIVIDMCEKFHYNWLRNDRDLGNRKSDNNKNPKNQWRMGFAKGWGADRGERAEREPKRGSGSRGRAPGGRSGGEVKLKAFCTFLYKKSGQKLRI